MAIRPVPRSVRRVAWITYWVMLAGATHLPPSSPVPLPGAGYDRVVHTSCFLLLTLLTHWAIPVRTPRILLAWGVTLLAYAALDEWTQAWVGRTPDPLDWVCDAAGIIGGTAYAFWRFAHRPLPRLEA